MARLRISATRSNLLSVRQRLRLAREGHDLLEKKRDVLIMEIMRLIGEAERVQRQVEERFRRAYESLQEARVVMGTERVRRIALSRPYNPEQPDASSITVHITPRSIMGVVVPSVHYHSPGRQLFYGFGDTSTILDEVQQQWTAVLDLMGELAETVTTVWRLALEFRRTTRRVNALESIFIPSYEETVRYIEDTLEEKDREEMFRMKRSKSSMSPTI